MSLFDPEVLHVAFAAVGGLLGWWLRTQRDPVPQELAEALQMLLERQRKKRTEGLLAELFDEKGEKKP